MKRILFSILAIVLTVGAASGTAYALFSNTVTVSGVTLATGNADLKINGTNDSLLAVALSTSNTYPGWQDGQYFTLDNKSTSDIGLAVTAKISGHSGSWDALKDVVQVAVIEYGGSSGAMSDLSDKVPGNAGTILANTGWKSLTDWEAAAVSIGTTIPKDGTHHFVMWARVLATADNGIAGKTVSTNWLLTGTQVTP